MRVDSNACAQRITAFPRDFLHLPRCAIHIGHSARFVFRIVHVYVAYYGVGDQRAVAGAQCVLDGCKWAAEIGKRAATAFARPTIVAGRRVHYDFCVSTAARPDRDRVSELGFDAFS